MKAQIFILGLFILYSCNSQTSGKNDISKSGKVPSDTLKREELTAFATLDKREVLKRLFDNPEFDSLGMAIWKGNYSDLTSLSIPLSYDGKFHTSLDTIFYFPDTKNRNCAVVIFSTYNFQLDPYDSSKIEAMGCHFCGAPIGAALFYQKDDENWELYGFKKEIIQLGYFGVYKTGRQDEGKIQLKQIGDKWTALSVTEGLGGNGGYLEGNEYLFSVEQYKMDGDANPILKILLINSYGFKETFLDKNILPEIKPIKKQGSYFGLSVRTINNETIRTKMYEFSPECEKYMELMH
jgi:hypothetical protein